MPDQNKPRRSSGGTLPENATTEQWHGLGKMKVRRATDRFGRSAQDVRDMYAVLAIPCGIRPDLIPATSWGASLYWLLTRDSWDALGQPVLRASAGLCRLCGRRAADCYELYAYGDAATVVRGVGYVAGMGEHPTEPLEDAYDGLGQERGDFSFAEWVRGTAG